MNIIFLKILLLNEILSYISLEKEHVFTELVDNATSPEILTSRFNMLSQLSAFESELIKKIHRFESDNMSDIRTVADVQSLIKTITNKDT